MVEIKLMSRVKIIVSRLPDEDYYCDKINAAILKPYTGSPLVWKIHVIDSESSLRLDLIRNVGLVVFPNNTVRRRRASVNVRSIFSDKPEKLVALVDSETFRLVNKEICVNGSQNEHRCEEDVDSVSH